MLYAEGGRRILHPMSWCFLTHIPPLPIMDAICREKCTLSIMNHPTSKYFYILDKQTE
jgi:hypothetical protein